MKNSYRLLVSIISILIILLSGLATNPALAYETIIQPDIQSILDRGELRVGLCKLDTPPFFYTDSSGELAGIDIDLAYDIAQELGVAANFIRLDSFDLVADEVAKNNVDIGISNLSITFTRANKVLYTQPYFLLHMGVLINQLSLPKVTVEGEKEYKFNRPSLRMAVLAGSSYEGFAHQNFPLAEHITYDSWDDMLAATEAGDTDLAFYDEVAIERTMRDDPTTSLKFKYVKLTEHIDPIAIAVPPQSPHFYIWLKHFVDLHSIDQNLKFHFDKYFDDLNVKNNEIVAGAEQIYSRKERQLFFIKYFVAGIFIIFGLYLYYRKGSPRSPGIHTHFKWMLSPWTIFTGMALGVGYGIYFKEFTGTIAVFGEIYLTFLNMCSLPIMITAIITSIGKLLMTPDCGKYFKILVTLFLGIIMTASILGLTAGVIGEPGSSLSQSSRVTLGNQLSESGHSSSISSSESISMLSFLKRLIPANIFNALSNNDVLGILIFSIVLGVSLGTLKNGSGEQVILQLDALFSAFINIINSSMYILPIALFCLMAKQVSSVGIGIMLAMSRFVIVYLCVCIVAIIGTFIIMARQLKTPVLKVISSLKEALIVAFGTSNSYGAMPFAISALESSFKLDKRNTNLVMPLGLTICRPGTILNLALGTVFMAQLFGLSLGEDYRWLVIIIGVVLSGIAASGAPSAIELSMMSIVLGFLGLPVEIAIVLLLSVDPITDPFRTVLNVITSCAMTSVIAEKET